MKINDFVRVFGRGNSIAPLRNTVCIFLPDIFHQATIDMCHSQQEIYGKLLCQPCPNNSLLVESIITLGIGGAYAVQPEKEKLRVARILFNIDPMLVPIDFHTHSIGTGNGFYQNFSSGDMQQFSRMIDEDNTYQHVLFTPTHICTFGLSKPDFYVTNVDIDIGYLYQRYQELQGHFKVIASLPNPH